MQTIASDKAQALVVLVACALFSIFSSLSAAAEEPSRTEQAGDRSNSAYVYAIDTSSSMRYIFDDLRGVVNKAVDHCGPDDCLSIVLFGDSVSTLASYTSVTPSKKKFIEKSLGSTSPEALYTNLGLAIKRGIEELHSYAKDNLASNYRLILVTDGKDHPPPNFTRDYSIEEALTRFPEFLPGTEWSLHYIALKGQIDPELLGVIEKYDGTVLDVKQIARLSQTSEREVVGRIIENLDEWKPLRSTIIEHDGEVKLKRRDGEEWIKIPEDKRQKVFYGDRISVGVDSSAVIKFGGFGKIGLMENAEVGLGHIQQLPISQSATIRLDLDGGAVWNSIKAVPDSSLEYEVLTPIALTGVRGTVFRLSFDPSIREQNVAVLEGTVEITSSDGEGQAEGFVNESGNSSTFSSARERPPLLRIPDKVIIEWTTWRDRLKRETPHESRKPIEIDLCKYLPETEEFVCKNINELGLGPIAAGETIEKRLRLKMREIDAQESLRIFAALDIVLPDGVRCSVAVDTDDVSNGIVDILIDLHIDDGVRILPGSEWKGRLVLTSPDQIVKFSQDGIIPLRFFAPEARQAARLGQPSFKPKMRTVWLYFWPIIGICLLIVVMQAVGQHGPRIIRRINPVQLHGWLLVTDSPAGVEVDDIDLQRLGREIRDSSFVIGRSERADIRLPHTSVDKWHARIYGLKRGSRIRMYIKNIGISKVDVNFSRIYQSVIELGDRDVIEIGEFQFFYTVSHLQQVVVHFKDGSVRHGVLQTWNMEGDSFSLLHRDKAGNETATHIDFSELKGIFFIQEYDEKIAKKIRRRAKSGKKDHIVVEFLDGEQMEGHIVGRYDPEAPRFLIAPLSKKKEDQNILCVLVERSFTKSVLLVKK